MTRRSTATARRPSDRGAQIVTAAATLFRKRGFVNVSMKDVAAEVGVTAPAIYRHFPGKDALLCSPPSTPA